MNSSVFESFVKVLKRVNLLSGVFISVKTRTQNSGVFLIISATIFWSSLEPLSRKSFMITRRFSARKGSACRFVPKSFVMSSFPSIMSMFVSPSCFFLNWSIQKLTFLLIE